MKSNATSNKKKQIKKEDPEESFPIVAIGASAGGLEAMTDLLKSLPPNLGMAYIYVQHLSPHHESMLETLLGNSTKMKVQQAKNNEKMLVNTVYVIPPNTEMQILDGHIKILERPKMPAISMPIDILFSSLAAIHKENVIGIILSGSATDGTLGLQAIKYEGGITFAQDESAKFDGMPKNAIATGVVDFVLSPKGIGEELEQISRHPLLKTNRSESKEKAEFDSKNPDFAILIKHLQKRTGVDFKLYKMNTIRRRIQRRMLLHKAKSLKEYVKFAIGGGIAKLDTGDPKGVPELDLLYADLLIKVTNFFRDAEACKYLKSTLLPRLLKSKSPSEPLRIWVPACSTGEEAYSIAIILKEIKDNEKSDIPIQIFATDLNQDAVNKARIGVYTKNEVANIPPGKLTRFFTKSNGNFRIAQAIRDLCVFAPQNILTDPPFSQLDFISCCNLLIYFDEAAQKKAIATFHYALKPEGYLMLGKSESVGQNTRLFSSVNKKLKLFQCKKNAGTDGLPVSNFLLTEHLSIPPDEPGFINLVEIAAKENDFEKTINQQLLAHLAPSTVVINKQMEILEFRGDTNKYLTHTSGKASLNILKMANPEITFELRNAIRTAFKTQKPCEKKPIELVGETNIFSLTAVPFLINEEPLLLIVFKTIPKEILLKGKNISESTAVTRDRRIKKMEEEMAAYRDELRTITHNYEASLEELQSANEEVVSSNEELRSINEELETSKEEIQSTNEELASINQEIQTRNELLNESYTYAESIINTIHNPFLILDKDLRIKVVNQPFYKKFRLREADTEGVLLYELGNGEWNIPKLRELLNATLFKNKAFENFEVEQEFPVIGKRMLLLNAKKIIQAAHREQLILFAIADNTEPRRLALEIQEDENKRLVEKIKMQGKVGEAQMAANAYIRNVFKQAPVSILVLKGTSFVVDMINEKGLQMWGTSYKKVINKPFFEIKPELQEVLGKTLTEVYNNGKPCILKEFSGKYKRNRKLYEGYFNLNLHPLTDLDGNITGITCISNDVTLEVVAQEKIAKQASEFENAVKERTRELKNANELLAIKNKELIIKNKELESFTYISSHDLQEPLRKIQTFAGRILDKEDQNLSEKGKDYFRRMNNAALRMQTLIRDLLDYSRLSTHDRKFELIDPTSIIEDIKDELNETIQLKNATIEIGEICQVKIIPFQFRQLMQNLISNSLKFSKPNVPLSVIIKSKIVKGKKVHNDKLLSDQEYCHITFSDNGIGFEERFVEKIFDVFQKLHRKEEYPGTGIGLAIVKKIVDNHHGVITVKSKLGKGTTFDIFIPV